MTVLVVHFSLNTHKVAAFLNLVWYFTANFNYSRQEMNVVTLFSGCGGLDLSFHQLGFNILWANDFDPKACESYAFNIGKHVVCEDITKVDISTIPNAELILGGFPCQDFSMIWKREGIDTERGNLYKNFVNIVSDKNPKMFVAENVKGLLTANKGQAIRTIIEDFSHTGGFGYNVKPHLVNFADYGAPQLRERVLLIGVRKDLNQDFKMPTRTHSPMKNSRVIFAKDLFIFAIRITMYIWFPYKTLDLFECPYNTPLPKVITHIVSCFFTI